MSLLMYHTHKRQPQSCRGFTLIEMMVALTIGLFLVGGLISLLVSTSVARTELDKSARQIENGRYTLRMLTQDVQHAGFLGRYMPTGATMTAPDPCATAVANLGFQLTPLQVPLPIYGHDGAAATPAWCANLATLANRLAGTDVLVVRRASTTSISAASAVAGETYLQVSSCADPVTPPPAFRVDTGSFALEEKDCTTPAPIRKYIVRIYYVSSCNVCTGGNADTIPTLKVAEYVGGNMTVTPMVEGIQNLQVDYGIDMDGNGSPDCYISNPTSPAAGETGACPATGYDWTPHAINHWANVMAVRMHVLARNLEASGGWNDTRTYSMGLAGNAGPFGDGFKRHVYSTVARAVNVSARRETP